MWKEEDGFALEFSLEFALGFDLLKLNFAIEEDSEEERVR